jgi:hypothetical protein
MHKRSKRRIILIAHIYLIDLKNERIHRLALRHENNNHQTYLIICVAFFFLFHFIDKYHVREW